jgi:uncharacterized protein YjbI with pentapeptide repeats
LLFGQIYLQMHLSQLWNAMARLPAVFPDGSELDERCYPWLMTKLVRRYVPKLNRRSLSAKSAELLLLFLGWWLVPVTALGLWQRCRVLDDRHIGTWQIVIVAVALVVARSTLVALAARFRPRASSRKGLRAATVLIWAGIGLVPIAMLRTMVTNKPPVADMTGADASLKPANYYALDELNALRAVRGAQLPGVHLKDARLSGTFLARANLQRARLDGADLSSADLGTVNLEGASLRGALLNNANLRGASLIDADLSCPVEARFCGTLGTRLIGVNLRGAALVIAKLSDSVLEKADLREAQLFRADLRRANLQNADVRGAKFHEAQMEGVKGRDAIFDIETEFPADFDPDSAGMIFDDQ